MKFVVLSDKHQYELFIKQGYSLSDFKILSDNPRFYEFLRSQNVPFEGVDEFLIESEWDKINSWAASVLSEWNQFCIKKKLFREINWCSAIRHSLTCILIQIVKNQKLARIVLNRYEPEQILVLEAMQKKTFPYFSGNNYLNFFLVELARERKIKIETIVLKNSDHEILKGDFPIPKQGILKANLGRLKNIFEISGSLRQNRLAQVDVIIFGALRHLKLIIKELRVRGERIAIYDFEYHTEQFLFALANQVNYWLPGHFSKHFSKKADPGIWAKMQFALFKEALEKSQSDCLFDFEGYSYGRILINHVMPDLEIHFQKLSKERVLYQTILEASHCKAWIVDEDYSIKGGFLSAFLKGQGIPVYCVSHANLTVNFSVPVIHQNFHQSTTFVHSEY